MSVSEILVLISALTAALVTVINAVKVHTATHKLDTNTQLTSETHALLNGERQKLVEALATVRAELAVLKAGAPTPEERR